MKRIVYLDHTGELGGAEHLLLTLFQNLPHDLVYPLLICAQAGSFPRRAAQLGVQVEVIRLPAFRSVSWVVHQHKILNPFAIAWNIVVILVAALRIAKRLRGMQVDMVQTNSALAHIYGGLAARLVGLPCIWYFHDLVEVKRLGGAIALVWFCLSRFLATRVVAVSQAVLRSLGASQNGTVIYAGQQIELPARYAHSIKQQLELPGDARIVGFTGRIGYVKGLDILAAAAQQAIRAEPRLHFVLFGEALFGEGACRDALVQRVRQLGLSEHWHMMGYEEHILLRVAEFDLFVLPSRREAFPLVLLEAAVAGKAAVASDVGGIPEIIMDGETGLLVPPEQPEPLAAAILKLIQNPAMADQMGRNARARVSSLFTLSSYIEKFVHLYDSIAVSKARPVRA